MEVDWPKSYRKKNETSATYNLQNSSHIVSSFNVQDAKAAGWQALQRVKCHKAHRLPSWKRFQLINLMSQNARSNLLYHLLVCSEPRQKEFVTMTTGKVTIGIEI